VRRQARAKTTTRENNPADACVRFKNFLQAALVELKVMNRMRAIGDFDPRKVTHTTPAFASRASRHRPCRQIDRQGS
jgi:hypothetical protein